MRICRDCGITKPESEFYAHPRMADGLLNSCKVCRRAYVKQLRINDPSIRQRDNARSKTAKRRAHLRANSERWAARHPEWRKAHYTANNAVRDGKLVKQPCQSCGSKKHVHKHHHDYAKPLDVVWLCAKCHSRQHHE